MENKGFENYKYFNGTLLKFKLHRIQTHRMLLRY